MIDISPAGGEIMKVVDHLEDLYEIPFDMDEAIGRNRVEELAENHITIKHDDKELGHLFHLMRGSIKNMLSFSLSFVGYVVMGAYLEERKLIIQYGPEYIGFRKTTGFLLPRLSSRKN